LSAVRTLEGVSIGLKVDVDTLRGTREGVPGLVALLSRLGLDATFYFSVGPDHTGRALRRAFRPGFAQKVARTSVLRHYGLKTLLYGVLLPGPDIGRRAGDVMRSVHTAGFEVGLHSYDHVRWQDFVAAESPEWTRREFERGLAAFEGVFGFAPRSHAAAGWQINITGLELEREHGLLYASDTRGSAPFVPQLPPRGDVGTVSCPQLPTTLPTFDELIGIGAIDEHSVAAEVFARSAEPGRPALQVFTLHAELEGMLLRGAFEELLVRWRDAGARITRMDAIHALAMQHPLPVQRVEMAEISGRSGRLAVQGQSVAAQA
jgi:undecaprenyl phosphate-alpha-L-ara4FN deformylase